ncbi:hypothetical protein [Rubrivirga sp. IMCC43871]|uniref:hypothetical protein n=1 Tax=Rubrivirga sp. IMCC43871 TaxID=3391575 RepID=UPI00398FB889
MLTIAALLTLFTVPSLAPVAIPGTTPARAVVEGRDLNFTIRNESELTIQRFYTWWCEDRQERKPLTLNSSAFPENVLYPGQSVVFAIEPGCTNFQIFSIEGYELYHTEMIDPDGVYVWRVHYTYGD